MAGESFGAAVQSGVKRARSGKLKNKSIANKHHGWN